MPRRTASVRRTLFDAPIVVECERKAVPRECPARRWDAEVESYILWKLQRSVESLRQAQHPPDAERQRALANAEEMLRIQTEEVAHDVFQ